MCAVGLLLATTVAEAPDLPLHASRLWDHPTPVTISHMTEPVSLTADDLDACWRTLYGEARGEPVAGQIAVAWVIRNRVSRPSWWGRTPAEVCHKPYQFSCWLASDPNCPKLRAMTEDNLLYAKLAQIVNDVFAGLYPDPTNGATHYKVYGTRAEWDKACAGKTPVRIGAHLFFNLGPSA